MARMDFKASVEASDSDDELPSLDVLLGRPRTALAPTSSNAATRSPIKSPKKLQNPSQGITAQALKESPPSSTSIDHVGLTKPILPSARVQKSPAKQTNTGSPSKAVEDVRNPESKSTNASRRQRALNSPVKSKTVLFAPLEETSGSSGAPRHKGTRAKRIQKPLSLSTDDEDEAVSEISQEFDIFKGTGISRKIPRRVAKKGIAYQEDRHDESMREDTYSVEHNISNIEDSIWSASSPALSSVTEDDDSFATRRRRAVIDDPLSLRFQALKLEKPALSATREVIEETRHPTRSPEKTRKALTVQPRTSRPTSSHSACNDPGAILQFSPPSSPSPSRLPPRPSTPPTVTPPPASPGKLKSPSKLTPPSKLQSAKPPAARPSLDAFWAQDIVNDYNDAISPAKPLISPRKKHLQDFFADRSDEDDSVISRTPSPTTSPRKKPATKTRGNGADAATKAEKQRLKKFNAEKVALANDFFAQLDDHITDGEIGRLALSSGGVQVLWNNKLNTTAGQASFRRERRIPTPPTGLNATLQSPTKPGGEEKHRHIAKIELASKVVTTEQRLYDTLAHEFCHLANFIVSHELKHPHGESFKKWARKTTAVFGKSHGVEVTTTHDYAITYKYIWRCEQSFCATEYKRHSKSINPSRQTCGKCRGRLVQILPKPRGSPIKNATAAGGETGDNITKGGGAKSEYSRFVKDNWASVKETLPPKSPAKDVMREVAVIYRERKTENLKGGEKVEVVEVVDEETEDVSAAREESVEEVARRLDFFRI